MKGIIFYRVFMFDDTVSPLGMLALEKCKPCSALDFKGAGNKMTIDDGIFSEKYLIE